MKLSDYPTPITDAAEAEDNGNPAIAYELCRGMERKLAMCRDELENCSDRFRDAEDDKGFRHTIETLKKTE